MDPLLLQESFQGALVRPLNDSNPEQPQRRSPRTSWISIEAGRWSRLLFFFFFLGGGGCCRAWGFVIFLLGFRVWGFIS